MTSHGRVFTWGYNSYYQVGNASQEHQYTPYDLTPRLNLLEDEGVIDVQFGNVHTLVMTNFGRVFGFGWGYNGQLGLESSGIMYVINPTLLNSHITLTESEDYIIKMETGQYTSYFLTEKGRLIVTGHDGIGKFGIDQALPFYSPTDITDLLPIDEGDQIIDIVVHHNNTMIFTASSKIYVLGYNSNNQFGLGTEVSSTTQYLEMTSHISLDIEKYLFVKDATFMIDSNHQLYGLGSNGTGHFGASNYNHYTSPYQINIPNASNGLIRQEMVDYESILDLYQPEKIGYTFAGWYEDELMTVAFTGTQMPMEDISLYAKWTPIQYNITFEENGGSSINDLTYFYEDSVSLPDNPIKEGYSFVGWYKDSDLLIEFSDSIMPAENITLYAKWQINQYTISLMDMDGMLIDELVFDYNEVIILPANPIKTGYTFQAWYEDQVLTQVFSLVQMPAQDFNLYGKWQINQYTIAFEENGGSLLSDLTLDYDESIPMLDNPLKEGYTFMGWYEDSEFTIEFGDINMPAQDLILFAKWQINQYSIFFEENGGNTINEILLDYQASIVLPNPPTKEGYTFLAWYEDEALEQAFTQSLMPANNLVLYAKWQVNQYSITFEENGGSLVDDILADYGSIINQPEDPSKEGLVFGGWYEDMDLSIPYEFDYIEAENIILYAKWLSKKVTVEYDIDDYDVPLMLGFSGDSLTLPTPSLTGRTFTGWYLEPELTTEVEWTTYPDNDVVLYGGWSMISYTITYDSVGGSSLLADTYYYQDVITEPSEPTKEGYSFAGWYVDTAYNISFSWSYMPAEDIILYARWIDETDQSSIFYQTHQPAGTVIQVTGVIYGKMKTGVTGLLIFDDTGYLAIDVDHSPYNVGDQINVLGLLNFYNGIPVIDYVLNIGLIGTNQPLPTITPIPMSELQYLSIDNMYETFSIEGILLTIDSNYYVFDPISLTSIMINYDTIDTLTELDFLNNIGNQISLDFVFDVFGDEPIASMLSYSVLALSIEEKALLIKSSIESNFNLVFFSGDTLMIQDLPYFGQYISYEPALGYEDYFDSVNQQFKNTDSQVEIPFEVTLTINDQAYTFTLMVTLMPMDIALISEVIDDMTGSVFLIDAIVISKSEMDMLLKDDSGYLYAYNIPYLEVGDYVRLAVRNDRDYQMTYLDFFDGDLVVKKIISKGNDLMLSPSVYTDADLLALDLDNLHIYGQYIEIRGQLLDQLSEIDYGVYIVTENNQIPLMMMSHGAFEKVFDYIGLEVIIRGFIYRDFDGSLMFYYEGIRNDLRIPEYTDQERVDILVDMFHHYYDGKTFQAFETIDIPPYHPVIGAEISWSFDDPNFAYYDFDINYFTYSMSDQIFAITITVTAGDINETIHYTSQLNAITVDEFSDLESYSEAFVEGLVVFYSPEYIYIMNDLGQMIKVEGSNLNAYKGDYVLLYGSMTMYYNGLYMQGLYNIDLVQEIISRNNPVVLPDNPMTMDELLAYDYPSELDKYIYIEITGKVEVYNNIAYLYSYDQIIVLNVPYDQVLYEISQYNNQMVTIKGYVSQSDRYYSTFSGRFWTIDFTGEPGDIVPLNLSNQEKFDYIEAFILDQYQISIYNNQAMDFGEAAFFFDDVDLTYTPLNDTLGLFDFTPGYNQFIESVDVLTSIDIQVDLSNGEDSYTFTFTIDILPDEEVTYTDILDIVYDDLTEQTIQGQVLASVYMDEGYALLISDASGIVLVWLPMSLYQSDTAYYYGYVGNIVEISGTASIVNSQGIFTGQTIKVTGADTKPTLTISDSTIADIYLMDVTDSTYVGQVLRVSGVLEAETTDYGDYFYLREGDQIIRIYNEGPSWSQLRNYVGLNVVMIVMPYGLDDDGLPTVLFNMDQYTSEEEIILGDYTEAEIAQMIEDSMIYSLNQYNPLRNAFDYVSYPSPTYYLLNKYPVTITFEPITGLDYINIYDDHFTTLQAPENIEIVVRVHLSVGSYQDTFDLVYYLNGFTLGSLEDLFDPTPSTQEIALQATILHSDFNKHYLIIEDTVYLYRGIIYNTFYKGDQVTIIGQKSVIDGIADYTYNIQVVSNGMTNSITLESLPMTLEEIYLNDFTLNPINQNILTIYGQVSYDKYLGYYTLRDGDYLVYLNMLQEGWEYIDYLQEVYNEYIYVDVVMPLEVLRGEFYLMDVLGYNSVRIKEYTSQEEITLIKEYIQSLGTIEVFAGDAIGQYIPLEYTFHPYLTLDFALTNENDTGLIDFNNLVINDISTNTILLLDLTLTSYDPINDLYLSETFTITIDIKPRPLTSITDVLYGENNTVYKIQGVIVAMNENEGVIILHDGIDEIVVLLDPVYIYDFSNITLNLGDEVIVIGERVYMSNGLIPIIYSPSITNVIASSQTVLHTIQVMTTADLLDFSLNDFSQYSDYVSIQAYIEWNQSTETPVYTLTLDRLIPPINIDPYEITMLVENDPVLHSELQALDGQELLISAYLIGIDNDYGPIAWYMILDDYDTIPV
ncbi:MAG: InlB B-repeat-containing protein [Candidatus Izemoplasmatales bacterium]